MSVTARAPGKLFLTGEWAVLRGAPALVAAVDRHASVTVEPGGEGVVVESVAEGRSEYRDPLADGPLPGGDAGAVLAALRQRREPVRGLRVAVDSRAFLVGERKLGLGRSAATLVAAAAALAPDEPPARILAPRARGERALPGGAGQRRRRGGGGARRRGRGAARRRRPRRRVAGAAGGHPPGRRLDRLAGSDDAAAGALRDRADAGRARRRCAAAAVAAADAVARDDAATLLDAVERSAALLVRLGAELDLPLVTPALATLVRTANRVGAAAKPSGAGAGDCGIALATSAAQAAARPRGLAGRRHPAADRCRWRNAG